MNLEGVEIVKHINQLSFMGFTEVIKNFIEQAKEYVTDNYESSIGFLKALNDAICKNHYWAATEGYGTSFASFQCHSAIMAIYFDHKVADSLSTFEKILYVGSVPTTDEKEYENIPLIKGCEKNKKKQDCPLTFYKTFRYTYHGIKVPIIENVVEFIDSQNKKAIEIGFQMLEDEAKLEED